MQTDCLLYLTVLLGCMCLSIGSIHSIDIDNQGLVQNNNQEVFLWPSLYGGLSNQKVTFQVAVYYCLMNNYTLVLPQWSFDYFMFDASVVQFDYLYSINTTRINELSDIRHFRYVITLPSHLLPSCLYQLQVVCADYFFYRPIEFLHYFATRDSVICLNAEESFYGLGNKENYVDFISEPTIQSFRSALVVSDLYQQIVKLKLNRMRERFGHTDFIAVHARVEEDFAEACKSWPRRGFGSNHRRDHRICYENESTISHLLDNTISFEVNNSVLLIMNFNRGDESFAELPSVCHRRCDSSAVDSNCKVYHCIRKESLVSDVELFELFPTLIQTPNSLAMIDTLLAQYAILFVGNFYSTMSVDIFYERQVGRTPYTESIFYNRLCSLYPDRSCP